MTRHKQIRHISLKERANPPVVDPVTGKPRRMNPVRCDDCRRWMRPGGGKGKRGREYAERSPAPRARRCVQCNAEKDLGLPRGATELLKKAAKHLQLLAKQDAQYSTNDAHLACYVGRESKSPEGNGATKHRHGCTCGLTEVLEGLETLRVLERVKP